MAPARVIGDVGDLVSERHALEKSKNRKIFYYIYIRPISCNKPVKYNSLFHCVKYKEDRILFGRFIT